MVPGGQSLHEEPPTVPTNPAPRSPHVNSADTPFAIHQARLCLFTVSLHPVLDWERESTTSALASWRDEPSGIPVELDGRSFDGRAVWARMREVTSMRRPWSRQGIMARTIHSCSFTEGGHQTEARESITTKRQWRESSRRMVSRQASGQVWGFERPRSKASK